MNSKILFSTLICLTLCNCSSYSTTSTTTSGDYLLNGVIASAAGAGVGAAIGSAITDGDIGESALLGAGVGLAVGVVGTYVYQEVKTHNQIIDNDNQIDSNRLLIADEQAELDKLRAEVVADSQGIKIQPSKTEKIYDGATLGVYYR